jgi:hypothetical protein
LTLVITTEFVVATWYCAVMSTIEHNLHFWIMHYLQTKRRFNFVYLSVYGERHKKKVIKLILF